MVYAKPRIRPGKWDAQTSVGFWNTNVSPNLGQTTRTNNSRQKNENCWIEEFIVLADHRLKLKESEKIDKYLDFAKELKKTVKHKSDSDTSSNWCLRYSHQRINTGTGRRENKRTCGDHPNYSFIKIGQNTEKSLWDLRKLAVTQPPVRNHRLTLVWKNPKIIIIIIIIVDFAAQADRKGKIKKSEKRDKYLALARELRKLWNIGLTVILIVIGALGRVPLDIERGL